MWIRANVAEFLEQNRHWYMLATTMLTKVKIKRSIPSHTAFQPTSMEFIRYLSKPVLFNLLRSYERMVSTTSGTFVREVRKTSPGMMCPNAS